MATALAPLGATGAVTTAASPAAGMITRYNATAGNLAVTLPALSTANLGAYLGLQKDTLDASTNTITVSCVGSDTFDDGTTSITLTATGQLRIVSVVAIGVTKSWKVIGGYNPNTGGSTTLGAGSVAPANLAAGGTAPDATKYYRGDGTWGAPATGSLADGSVTPAKLAPGGSTPGSSVFYRGDGVWAAPPSSGGTGGGSVPTELTTGASPTGTVHANAGTGATLTIAAGGTRLSFKATVTTGTAPVSGGIFATFTLAGYTYAPKVAINPQSLAGVQSNAWALTTPTLLTLNAASELTPNTAYAFDLVLIGA
jgi:hypothetical protein